MRRFVRRREVTSSGFVNGHLDVPAGGQRKSPPSACSKPASEREHLNEMEGQGFRIVAMASSSEGVCVAMTRKR